jgi:hypothetical protein
MADFNVPAYLAARANRQDSGRALMAATADYFRTFVTAQQNRAQLDLQERRQALEEEKFRQEQQAIEEARRQQIEWLSDIQPVAKALSEAPTLEDKWKILESNAALFLRNADGVRMYGHLTDALKAMQAAKLDTADKRLIAMSAEHLLNEISVFNEGLKLVGMHSPEKLAEILKLNNRPVGWMATTRELPTQEEASAVYKVLVEDIGLEPVIQPGGRTEFRQAVGIRAQALVKNIELEIKIVDNQITALEKQLETADLDLKSAQRRKDKAAAEQANARILEIQKQLNAKREQLESLRRELESLRKTRGNVSGQTVELPGGISYEGFLRSKGQ